MSFYFRLRNRFFAFFYTLFYYALNLKRAFFGIGSKDVIRGDSLKQRHSFEVPKLPQSPEKSNMDGVNWVGFLSAENGIGQSQRNLICAAIAAGVDVACSDLSYVCPARAGDREWSHLSRKMIMGRKTIFHLNPPDISSVARCLGKRAFQLGPNIGYWAWELPELPDSWLQSIETYSEIWTPSSFCADTFKKKLKIPVRVVPMSIRIPEKINNLERIRVLRKQLGLPLDAYLFGTIFDINSTLSRKNPVGGISAFKKAFNSTEDCFLIVKVNCSKNTQIPLELKKLFEDSGKHNIIFINEVWDRNNIDSFFYCIDGYISLHRSEGFGMPIAEAMSFGKCCVSTGWSGNMDFLNGANGFPINYSLVEIERQDGPYEIGNRWAEPDVDHAVECMRVCYDKQYYSKKLGLKAYEDIKSKYSPQNVGKILSKILER